MRAVAHILVREVPNRSTPSQRNGGSEKRGYHRGGSGDDGCVSHTIAFDPMTLGQTCGPTYGAAHLDNVGT